MNKHNAHKTIPFFIDQPPKTISVEVKLRFSGNNCFINFEAKEDIFPKHFWRLVNKIRKFVICIQLIHVKLQLQRIKTLEMRAKTNLRPNIFQFFNGGGAG